MITRHRRWQSVDALDAVDPHRQAVPLIGQRNATFNFGLILESKIGRPGLGQGGTLMNPTRELDTAMRIARDIDELDELEHLLGRNKDARRKVVRLRSRR